MKKGNGQISFSKVGSFLCHIAPITQSRYGPIINTRHLQSGYNFDKIDANIYDFNTHLKS